MPVKAPATITDVAREAGVAIGTVSRVMNQVPDVNAEIRERVLAAAKKLGYSRLRRRKVTREKAPADTRGAIGVICFGMEDTLVQLPVISGALQGIEGALAVRHMNLMLANIPRGDRVPPFLAEGLVRGLILKGPNQGGIPVDGNNALLRAVRDTPHVWLMGRPTGATGPQSNFDADTAAWQAAEHLQEKGHRRVAFFNPKPGQVQFERLQRGFVAAATALTLLPSLLESKAKVQLQWPLPATTIQERVDRLAEEWHRQPAAERPTGLFVPSDRTAVQLYSAFSRLGVKIGREVSVVSCNNERVLVAGLDPALTTIDIHAEEIGRNAVELLLMRIEQRLAGPAVQMLVEPELVKRDSVVDLS